MVTVNANFLSIFILYFLLCTLDKFIGGDLIIRNVPRFQLLYEEVKYIKSRDPRI